MTSLVNQYFFVIKFNVKHIEGCQFISHFISLVKSFPHKSNLECWSLSFTYIHYTLHFVFIYLFVCLFVYLLITLEARLALLSFPYACSALSQSLLTEMLHVRECANTVLRVILTLNCWTQNNIFWRMWVTKPLLVPIDFHSIYCPYCSNPFWQAQSSLTGISMVTMVLEFEVHAMFLALASEKSIYLTYSNKII